jgi:multidrug efflux pump subunit AcrA (membrane-fusion protein)
MTVKAPQDGIVVYRTNWRDEKKKVGDSMWFGETVLALPDLTEMRADGLVDEADGGGVAAGQKVTLRLEARPDLDVHGRVRTVGRTVRQKSWRNPVKVYKVDIALDRTDPGVMRPAMRFRGEIETGRVAGLLLAPRDAVFLRESGPVVWVRRAMGWREVPVRLGRSNRRQVEVLSGVGEGDRLSPTDLATAAAGPRRAAAGAAR